MALVLDGTNGVSGVDGTASNPAIEGTDSNTGIFYPSADTVAIGTGGTEALRVNSSQNVGIGTSSPGAALDVEGLGNTVAAHIFTSDNVLNATASLVFGTTPGARSKASVSMVNTSTGNGAGALVLSTNNGTSLTERLRIDSSGNLGLGVTPRTSTGSYRAFEFGQSGYLSAVASGEGIYLASNAYIASGAVFTYSTTGAATSYGQFSGTHRWYNAPSGTAGNAITFTQAMTLDASGKFLVGTTTSPNQQAVIYRTSATTSNGALLLDGNGSYAGLQIATSGTLRGSISSDNGDFYITHVGNINFRTGSGDNVGGTTRATITGDGILSLRSSTANGVYLQSAADFAMASNATVAITSLTAGACLILVYEPATGDGGMFWANFSAVVTKVAGDGSATDAGSTFAVYKSAASHTTTIKNRYGVSKNFRIAVYSAQANP